ncbi:MAG: GIY-YIG nuclease family protein [Arenicellales bacterium]
MKQGYVYILTNPSNKVLYTGVTSDLPKRIDQHKNADIQSFTHKYKCNKLVWFEQTDDIVVAIEREKQIKAGSRKKKLALIETMNPSWGDLSDGWY